MAVDRESAKIFVMKVFKYAKAFKQIEVERPKCFEGKGTCFRISNHGLKIFVCSLSRVQMNDYPSGEIYGSWPGAV